MFKAVQDFFMYTGLLILTGVIISLVISTICSIVNIILGAPAGIQIIVLPTLVFVSVFVISEVYISYKKAKELEQARIEALRVEPHYDF